MIRTASHSDAVSFCRYRNSFLLPIDIPPLLEYSYIEHMNNRSYVTVIEQDSKIPAQRKEYKIIQNEAEDAGRLTPVKDDNEVMEDFAP